MSQGIEINFRLPSPEPALKRKASELESAPENTPSVRRENSFELKKVKTLSLVDEKMRVNFFKAIQEHHQNRAILPHLELVHPKGPLYLHTESSSDQGKFRKEMEDAHLDCEIPEGRLMGIFDGHTERGRIAGFVAEYFEKNFSYALKNDPEDIAGVFTDMCSYIHSYIVKNKDKLHMQMGGTTALVSFFDKTTQRLYTATLGDSEAKIYRKENGKIYSIPLSCVRNWCSKKDMQRLEEVVDDPSLFEKWKAIKEAKARRFPFTSKELDEHRLHGLNAPRVIGDINLQMNGKSALSQKPKVTLSQLLPGDLLVLGCDGLWDPPPVQKDSTGKAEESSNPAPSSTLQQMDTSSNTENSPLEQDLINKVISPLWGQPGISTAIVRYARYTRQSTDNISVVTAWVSEDSSPPELSLTQPLVEDTF